MRRWLLAFGVALPLLGATHAAEEPAAFEVKLQTLLQELNPQFCWFHPRPAPLPGHGKDGAPAVIVTLQKHLAVSDLYGGLHYLRSDDLGKTWKGPIEIPELAMQKESDKVQVSVADVTPGWHAKTGKLLALGARVRYGPRGEQLDDRPLSHQTAYTVFDPKTNQWTAWRILELPREKKFNFARNACSQWLVENDGTLLVPLYHAASAATPASVSVVRCTFDGTTLKYQSAGNELTTQKPAGLYEPSLIAFRGKYYLTLRNDARGYAAVSDDGLTFGPLQPWTFDDGKELGSYNTQQHWIASKNGLYLCYTRRGANNDHIFRHRAPLFVAQVDPQRLQVLRKTEKVLMPERGLTLGNFGAAAIDARESWVTDAEYTLSGKAHPRGGDGSVFLARVLWSPAAK